ncbi:unnamed protein product [[Actinomadura] parvosata subsp. kistnae]|uniref:Cell division protein DivIVA n=1 Tax=[Actinomadura] parvosata subsp. kistnae TaxID=1909395 RepID=A0A1V0AF60_9ACTN|nr:hypothetical protein [Nonomuraea sp. ATCC 55076]AQZ68860.1 hypothetical protein BKM31_51910 [Nonomuraea sp. ATCC 55076]SPL92614.1 unnamed protein product [Actinomadura parvosata subsp. kistnae]
MLVILAIAAIAILACVVLVSLGRGGELTEFPPDVPPLDLPDAGHLTAVDFMALQLPVNLVGYHTQSVDETLRRAAGAISARDTRIAVLEQRVSELLSSRLHARQEIYAAPGAGPRTEHQPEPPAVPRELPDSGDPVSVSGTSVDWEGGGAELTHLPEEPEWRLPRTDAEPAPNGKAAAEPKSEDEPKSGDEPKDQDEPQDEPEAEPKDQPEDQPEDQSEDRDEPKAEESDGGSATDDERPAVTAKEGDERP